jgi:biopolymer transport protein ExbB
MTRLTRRVLVGLAPLLTAAPVAADDGAATLTLGRLYAAGGPVMHALAVLALIAAVLTLRSLLATRLAALCPPRLQRALETLLPAGRLQEAEAEVAEGQSLLARVVQAGLARRTLLQGDPALTRAECVGSVRSAMEAAGRRETARVRTRVILVAQIGAIAPLVGLVGTIVALARLFHPLSEDLPAAGLLARQVMEALIATGAGLALGVVALAAYAVLRSRLSAALSEAEIACEGLADRLARHLPGARLEPPAVQTSAEPAAPEAEAAQDQQAVAQGETA